MKSINFNAEILQTSDLMAVFGGVGGPTTSTSFYYDAAYVIGMFCAGVSQMWAYYSYGGIVAQ